MESTPWFKVYLKIYLEGRVLLAPITWRASFSVKDVFIAHRATCSVCKIHWVKRSAWSTNTQSSPSEVFSVSGEPAKERKIVQKRRSEASRTVCPGCPLEGGSHRKITMEEKLVACFVFLFFSDLSFNPAISQ